MIQASGAAARCLGGPGRAPAPLRHALTPYKADLSLAWGKNGSNSSSNGENLQYYVSSEDDGGGATGRRRGARGRGGVRATDDFVFCANKLNIIVDLADGSRDRRLRRPNGMSAGGGTQVGSGAAGVQRGV
ncbi:hypothetical protein EVAR_50859_1 [Eumeta japonica]|uniref:Uncharacterized protein n=1 Tax=Eumeta variegata TaxID=151549 RepID=A0A4C1Y5Y9_EUMVA|nr:hypothetical protein EVAR_50859_1 [Eumeta japonica]